MSLYVKCVKAFGWSLAQIDETDFETLIEFLFFDDETSDPNTRVIGGKVYKRAQGAPSWL